MEQWQRREGLRNKVGGWEWPLAFPDTEEKYYLFFPRKGACLSHQWTAQGCLAWLQKWPMCDSDIVSIPVHPCGTMKTTMKCPEGQFPCPKESANYLRSNLSFHPFPLCSFIGRHVSVCITCAFVTSCVSVWVFVSMCIFMRKTFSCLQCCSSQGFTWCVLWKFPEISCICWTWTQHPLLCDHFVTLRFTLSICCLFIKLLKTLQVLLQYFPPLHL